MNRGFCNPGWIFYGDWNKESGYRLADKLYRTGATALFCMSDCMAGGLYNYFYEKGIRVGEDISITGFDNQEMAEYLSPGLTTMELNLHRIGHEAARILLDRLALEDGEGAEKETELYIPCNFIERKSVKRI